MTRRQVYISTSWSPYSNPFPPPPKGEDTKKERTRDLTWIFFCWEGSKAFFFFSLCQVLLLVFLRTWWGFRRVSQQTYIVDRRRLRGSLAKVSIYTQQQQSTWSSFHAFVTTVTERSGPNHDSLFSWSPLVSPSHFHVNTFATPRPASLGAYDCLSLPGHIVQQIDILERHDKTEFAG